MVSSNKSCVSSILSWSSCSIPIMVSSCKQPVLAILSWCTLLPALSRPVIQAPSHSAILQPVMRWLVVSSSLFRVTCSGQLYQVLCCKLLSLGCPIMVRSNKSCVPSSSYSIILQPAMIMVSCIKLLLLGYPIMVSCIKSCVTSSLYSVILALVL